MTNDEDSLPIDSTMIERWTNQWKRQLGFNDEQLIKRNQKVEEFAMVRFETKEEEEKKNFWLSVSFRTNQNEENQRHNET